MFFPDLFPFINQLPFRAQALHNAGALEGKPINAQRKWVCIPIFPGGLSAPHLQARWVCASAQRLAAESSSLSWIQIQSPRCSVALVSSLTSPRLCFLLSGPRVAGYLTRLLRKLNYQMCRSTLLSPPTPFHHPMESGKRMAYPGGSCGDFPSLTGVPDGVQAHVHPRPQLPVPSTSCGLAAGWESWVGQGPAASGDPAFPEVPGGKDGVSGGASGLQDPQALSAPTHTCQRPLVLPGAAMNPETLSTSTFIGEHCIHRGVGCGRFTAHKCPFPGDGGVWETPQGKHLLHPVAAPTQVTEELTAPPTPSQGGKLRPRGANVWARFPAQSWDATPSPEKRSISRCWSSAISAGRAGGRGELRGLSCLQVLSLR